LFYLLHSYTFYHTNIDKQTPISCGISVFLIDSATYRNG
jgi:hypothetical protein